MGDLLFHATFQLWFKERGWGLKKKQANCGNFEKYLRYSPKNFMDDSMVQNIDSDKRTI